ncbi:hypothetical protein BN1013_00786 [Candidatus Rubidus massiliensis]|nr:MAG: hypothetical protein BGO10_08425 [Chlamydia sp. 32-24]CDZ80279.1 hypothetical protein BN1013_00786 [Candidatus Rubidus massiliensis]
MTSKRKNLSVKNSSRLPKVKSDLIEDLRQMIEKTRQSVALAINSSLTALYWKIGHRIRSEILQDKRADYGKEIVATISNRIWTRFCRKKPSENVAVCRSLSR